VPEYIRTLLDPHVNVRGGGRQKRKIGIETTYIPIHSRPEAMALAAIGKVSWSWAVLEHMLQILLTRLAMTAQFPALVLTIDLSMDNRLRAIKVLLSLHQQRYGCEMVDQEILSSITAQIPKVISLKTRRNRVVHGIWIAHGGPDKLLRLRTRTPKGLHVPEEEDTRLTVEQIETLAREIEVQANGLFVLAQLVPEADEAWLAKSLSRAKRRRRETQPKQEAQPPASPE